MLNLLEKFIELIRRRYHRHYHEKKIHLAIDVGLGIVVLILAAWVLALLYGNFSYAYKLKMTFSCPAGGIISGNETVFEIKYANTSATTLSDAKISLSIPENFILKQVLPAEFYDQRTNSFSAGNLIPGANGLIRIVGTPFGPAGETVKIIAKASYVSVGDFNNELFASDLAVNFSALNVKWNHGEVLYRGQPTTMSFELKNVSQTDLNRLELKFDQPDVKLEAIAGEAALNDDGNGFILEKLAPGSAQTVNFNLFYGGEKERIDLGFTSQAQMNNKKIKQAEDRQSFGVSQPDLSVKINPVKTSAGANDDISFEIVLKNSGQDDLVGLILDLTAASPRHSLQTLKMAAQPFVRLRDRQIIFDKNLSAGETERLEISVGFTRREQAANDEFKLKAAASYRQNGGTLKAYYFSLPVKIRTNYEFKAQTRYFSAYGDQLGVGPIPPLAGIPTKYWVFWQLKNSGNELKNLRVSASLAQGVIWSEEDSVNKGALGFNLKDKAFTWNVDKVDAQDENCRLALALTVIPGSSQVGSDILLLKDIKYDFIDAFTQEEIFGSAGDLTTNLAADNYALDFIEQNSR